jgi:Protein of unknown function (DUF1592)/Protein of unknown function (DUF1588)
MRWTVGLLVVGLLSAACGRTTKDGVPLAETPAQGGTGSGGTSGSAVSGSAGAAGTTGAAGAASCVSPARLAPSGRRPLGQAELRNELALFGEPLGELPLPRPLSRIYDLEERDFYSTFLVEYEKFVASLAERVTSDPKRLGALLNCDVPTDVPTCTAHLLDFVANRLYRGLAEPAALEQVGRVLEEGQESSGFPSGAKAVLETALRAREFLYHVEVGRPMDEAGATRFQLTDLELASRLSFLLWGTGPDDELLGRARAGRLSQPDELATEAQRLLRDARAQAGIARFYRELLGIDEGRRFDDDSGVPPDVLELMDREFSSFVWHATVDEGKGDVESLVEPLTWVNGPLARYYGWPGVEGDALRPFALDETRYAGLLTMPAWVTRASGPSSTHPSVRGWWVARGLLCHPIPPEPEGVKPAPSPPGITKREWLSQHAAAAVCAGCHLFVDPPGLALEHLDPLGRYRDDDQGLTIDTSNLPYDGVRGLAGEVVQASEEQSCLMLNWMRFALGFAALLSEDNDCPSELEHLAAKTRSVPEVLIALTGTEAFRYRAAPP